MANGVERFLCLASSENGQEFLREAASAGVRVTLLTLDRLRDGNWPREALEELATMPSGLSREQILNTVCWMARTHCYDRVMALDEADLELVSHLREHLRVPGMGITTAGYYRDRLGMRISARESGFPVSAFCRVLDYDELRHFMETVAPPWQLRPRSSGTAGARRIQDAEQLWRALDDLGDQQSHFLLEAETEGELYSVDSILSDREVLFSVVYQPTWETLEGRSEATVYTAVTMERSSRAWLELTALNAGLAPSLGMVRGVTHAEFLRSKADGRFYFQQIEAPIVGGFGVELVEAATGVNPWREWARLEVAHLRGQSYVLPELYELDAGLVLCRTEGADVDLSGFQAAEIVGRLKREHRAGFLVRSASAKRVRELLKQAGDMLTGRTAVV
jgi:hypothetical protein